MARDPGLEELIAEDLADVPGLSVRPMFGGLAWLYQGHLLCGARREGLLVRLGPGRDDWALALAGISPKRLGRRPMPGWVQVADTVCGDDGIRRRLLTAALEFAKTLGAKRTPPPAIPWDFPDHPAQAGDWSRIPRPDA